MGMFPRPEDYCPDCGEIAMGRFEGSGIYHDYKCGRFQPSWDDPGSLYANAYKQGAAAGMGLLLMAFAIRANDRVRGWPCNGCGAIRAIMPFFGSCSAACMYKAPCVSPSGDTNAHGKWIRGCADETVCAFCGRPV